jgi:hypothetical protein
MLEPGCVLYTSDTPTLDEGKADLTLEHYGERPTRAELGSFAMAMGASLAGSGW